MTHPKAVEQQILNTMPDDALYEEFMQAIVEAWLKEWQPYDDRSREFKKHCEELFGHLSVFTDPNLPIVLERLRKYQAGETTARPVDEVMNELRLKHGL